MDPYSDVILIVKLIEETKVFEIQPSYVNTKGSEFVDLFLKKSAIINVRVLLQNYKNCIRRNWSLNKDRADMFESNKNASTKKNNGITVYSDYNSNNMWKTIYLAVSSLGYI